MILTLRPVLLADVVKDHISPFVSEAELLAAYCTTGKYMLSPVALGG